MFEELYNRLLARRALEPPPPEPPPIRPAKRRAAMRFPDSGTALVEWIDAEDKFRREEAPVQDVSTGGIGLWLSARLSSGWPVLIEHRGVVLRGSVRHAEAVGDRWATGFQVVKDERRRSDRIPYESPARLTWEENAETREEDARIVDASEGGVQIAIPVEVPPATVVSVRAGGWQRFGTVAYSRCVDDEFRIGVHFSGPPIAEQSPDYED